MASAVAPRAQLAHQPDYEEPRHDDAPSWLAHLAGFFPLSHLVDAFSSCFVPGASVDGGDLASLAIWGAAGMFVAVRRLRVLDGAGRSRVIPSFR